MTVIRILGKALVGLSEVWSAYCRSLSADGNHGGDRKAQKQARRAQGGHPGDMQHSASGSCIGSRNAMTLHPVNLVLPSCLIREPRSLCRD